MILAFNPGSIAKSAEETTIQGKPYFLVLDSLGETHSQVSPSIPPFLKLFPSRSWNDFDVNLYNLLSRPWTPCAST